jgi:hypothetical protein
MPSSIVRAPTLAETELLGLRGQLRARRRDLTSRELELGDLRGQLISFEGRYLRQVGILLKQLDQWEERIAELHVKHNMTAPSEAPLVEAEDTSLDSAHHPNRRDLRALFRELAKRIHPDFATSSEDEQHRTRLMAQANDAFLRHDARSLQRLLDGHDSELATTSGTAAEIEAAKALLREVEHDIETAEAEIATLQSSDTAQLQRRTIQAALEGRDLLAEMAVRIKGRIGLAMREYELDLTRIKNPPKGPRVEDLVTAEIKPKAAPRFDPMRRVWVK